jgi:hypothetical protein
MENDILRMQLQASAAGFPELGCNAGLAVPCRELDRIVSYGLQA